MSRWSMKLPAGLLVSMATDLRFEKKGLIVTSVCSTHQMKCFVLGPKRMKKVKVEWSQRRKWTFTREIRRRRAAGEGMHANRKWPFLHIKRLFTLQQKKRKHLQDFKSFSRNYDYLKPHINQSLWITAHTHDLSDLWFAGNQRQGAELEETGTAFIMKNVFLCWNNWNINWKKHKCSDLNI